MNISESRVERHIRFRETKNFEAGSKSKFRLKIAQFSQLLAKDVLEGRDVVFRAAPEADAADLVDVEGLRSSVVVTITADVDVNVYNKSTRRIPELQLLQHLPIAPTQRSRAENVRTGTNFLPNLR